VALRLSEVTLSQGVDRTGKKHQRPFISLSTNGSPTEGNSSSSGANLLSLPSSSSSSLNNAIASASSAIQAAGALTTGANATGGTVVLVAVDAESSEIATAQLEAWLRELRAAKQNNQRKRRQGTKAGGRSSKDTAHEGRKRGSALYNKDVKLACSRNEVVSSMFKCEKDRCDECQGPGPLWKTGELYLCLPCAATDNTDSPRGKGIKHKMTRARQAAHELTRLAARNVSGHESIASLDDLSDEDDSTATADSSVPARPPRSEASTRQLELRRDKILAQPAIVLRMKEDEMPQISDAVAELAMTGKEKPSADQMAKYGVESAPVQPPSKSTSVDSGYGQFGSSNDDSGYSAADFSDADGYSLADGDAYAVAGIEEEDDLCLEDGYAVPHDGYAVPEDLGADGYADATTAGSSYAAGGEESDDDDLKLEEEEAEEEGEDDMFALDNSDDDSADDDTRVGDWNYRFQTIISEILRFQPNTPPAEKINANVALIGLAQDFLYSATSYGKIIISEVYLPDTEKTIKPINIGGVAGGSKYLVRSILFKFALDTEGIYGGNDAAAAKVAGHELKGVQAYFNCSIQGLCLPLIALVDYRGFRLLAISLLPITRETLICGSHDGGRTVLNKDTTFDRKMKHAAGILNIRGHDAGTDPASRTFIHSAADVEGHLGTDGRYYLVDFSRTFPCEKPRRDITGSHLFRLLRPELVKEFPRPLCSDAFSNFTSAEYNDEVAAATEHLLNDRIPNLAASLPEMLENSDKGVLRITEVVHARGVNIRWLGLVFTTLQRDVADSALKRKCLKLVLLEMMARVIKQDIRRRLRGRMKKLKLPLEDPYCQLIADYLNIVFGNNKKSGTYWEQHLEKQLVEKFHGFARPAVSSLHSMLAGDATAKWELLDRVRALASIQFTRQSVSELHMNHNNRFDKAKPIARQDVSSISERVKHMQIISNAEGELLLMRAHQLGNTDRPQAITCLIQAIEKFEVVLNSNPHSKATLRQCAQAIGNLELERSRGVTARAAAGGSSPPARPPALDINSATLSRANQYFLRAITLDPHDPLTLLAYAHFLEQCDRASLAEEYYLQVLENDPNYIEALHDYGQLLEEMGEGFYAEKFFMRIAQHHNATLWHQHQEQQKLKASG